MLNALNQIVDQHADALINGAAMLLFAVSLYGFYLALAYERRFAVSRRKR
jgi:hypothetical protein